MGVAKHMLQEHEDRLSFIEAIAVEQKALVYDADKDETSSNEDPDADMEAYASVFRAWADGKIKGTPDEIFEAIKAVLEQ
jgi:hypothetical protein